MGRADQTALGRRVRKLRQQAGFSQSALGESLVTAAYISTIEAGKRRPSRDVLEHLAKGLGTTVEYLLTGRAPHLAARLQFDIERARALVIQGQADQGLEQARALADDARKNGLPAHEGRAEEVVGRALLRLGRRPDALEAFRRSIELMTDEPVEAWAASVTGAARCLFQMGDVHHAIHELEAYLIDVNRRPSLDPDAAMQVFGALIGPYFEAGLFDKARAAATEVERLESRVSDPETLACSHLNLAGVYLSEGRLEDALRAMGKAETLFLQVGAVTDAAKADINQAMVFIEGEKWEDARLRLKAALTVLADAPAATDQARALTQLGRVERLSGDSAKAVGHLQEALGILGAEELNERALAQRELGLCLIVQGNLDAGKRVLEESVESYKDASNPVQVGLTYMLLGDTLRGQEKLDPIARLYREGLEQATRGAI